MLWGTASEIYTGLITRGLSCSTDASFVTLMGLERVRWLPGLCFVPPQYLNAFSCPKSDIKSVLSFYARFAYKAAPADVATFQINSAMALRCLTLICIQAENKEPNEKQNILPRQNREAQTVNC